MTKQDKCALKGPAEDRHKGSKKNQPETNGLV